MILLIPMAGKDHLPANFPKAQEIEHVITSMATAMSSDEDVALLVDESKLAEWLPVFELADPTPVLVTGLPDTVVPPVWTTIPTILARRDALVIDEERKVAREQSTSKKSPVDANDHKAMSLRSGGGMHKEPALDVVEVNDAEDADTDEA